MRDIVNLTFAGYLPSRQILAHTRIRLGIGSLVPHLPCSVRHLKRRSVDTTMCTFYLLHQIPVHQILAFVKDKPGITSPERMNTGDKGHDHVISVLMLEHIGSPESALSLHGFRQVRCPDIIPVFTVVLGCRDPDFTAIYTGHFLQVRDIGTALRVEHPPFLPLRVPFERRVGRAVIDRTTEQRSRRMLNVERLVLCKKACPVEQDCQHIYYSFHAIQIRRVIHYIIY